MMIGLKNYTIGDVITSSYPLSASITREFMPENQAGARKDCTNLDIDSGASDQIRLFKCTPEHPHFWALKNRLNFYGIRSEHYKVTSSHGNKMSQSINLISIPTIFYGSKIKPGTLSLKWYLTGTLIGELQDKKQNGELIQVSGTALFQNKVAGVVLYDEGFILLTGSWALNHQTIGLVSGTIPRVPKNLSGFIGVPAPKMTLRQPPREAALSLVHPLACHSRGQPKHKL